MHSSKLTSWDQARIGAGYFKKTDPFELDGNQICALVGPDLVAGVAGFGDSVHDALRELADSLVKEGVWIEVTNRTEWDVREKRDE